MNMYAWFNSKTLGGDYKSMNTQFWSKRVSSQFRLARAETLLVKACSLCMQSLCGNNKTSGNKVKWHHIQWRRWELVTCPITIVAIKETLLM